MSKLSDQATGSRIAVVEESSENIYSMRFILQSLGYDVSSVQPTEEFVERIEALEPAVVLVDMLMAGGTGLQALEILKRSHPNLPVLAVTADAVPCTEAEMEQAGADAILSKPYTVSEMQEKIEKVQSGG